MTCECYRSNGAADIIPNIGFLSGIIMCNLLPRFLMAPKLTTRDSAEAPHCARYAAKLWDLIGTNMYANQQHLLCMQYLSVAGSLVRPTA